MRWGIRWRGGLGVLGLVVLVTGTVGMGMGMVGRRGRRWVRGRVEKRERECVCVCVEVGVCGEVVRW